MTRLIRLQQFNRKSLIFQSILQTFRTIIQKKVLNFLKNI